MSLDHEVMKEVIRDMMKVTFEVINLTNEKLGIINTPAAISLANNFIVNLIAHYVDITASKGCRDKNAEDLCAKIKMTVKLSNDDRTLN